MHQHQLYLHQPEALDLTHEPIDLAPAGAVRPLDLWRDDWPVVDRPGQASLVCRRAARDTPMNRQPIFGDDGDIWLARGKPHPFTGRSMETKRRIPLWQIRGAGPSGKRCSDCVHLTVSGGTVRPYYKCRLSRMTRGRATDIGSRDPACVKFSPVPPQKP